MTEAAEPANYAAAVDELDRELVISFEGASPVFREGFRNEFKVCRTISQEVHRRAPTAIVVDFRQQRTTFLFTGRPVGAVPQRPRRQPRGVRC